jgi:hypothetical protein
MPPAVIFMLDFAFQIGRALLKTPVFTPFRLGRMA